MLMHDHSKPYAEPPDVPCLRERVHLLTELLDFRQALAEVCRRPHWETEPLALQQIGVIAQRCAPHSNDRSGMYSFAREMYRRAATATGEPALHAEAWAGIGACYFEEGRLDDAARAFEQGRAVDPGRYQAHLGLLALACAARDRGAIRRVSRGFVEAIPDWHTKRAAVASLAVDPDFAFLRASPRLFLECFGSYPDHLRALHDRYCMEALEQGLAQAVDPSSSNATSSGGAGDTLEPADLPGDAAESTPEGRGSDGGGLAGRGE
jgi:tetratricopeptide (TPR) repeat protein